MRRKPVKIWQILMCAALVVLVFVLFTLFQKSDSIAFQDGVFSQQAADSSFFRRSHRADPAR